MAKTADCGDIEGKSMKRLVCVKKSILAILLAFVTCASFVLLPIEAQAKKDKGATYAVGDNISFGVLDGKVLSWTILEYDDKTKIAFVVGRKALSTISITDYRRSIDQLYRNTGQTAGYVRWSENYWRGWCNEVFYRNNFTDEEREMIQKTTLSEKDARSSILNYYHNKELDALFAKGTAKNSINMAIYNSQTTTSDYIFFMSVDEYIKYKDKMGFSESSNIWPLRTNAYDDPVQGLFVNERDKMIYRQYYYSGDAIRPAMYVKLGEVEVDDTKNSTTTTSKTDENTAKSDTKASDANTDTKATNTDAKDTDEKNTKAASNTAEKAKTIKKASYANNGTNTGNVTLPDDSSYSMKKGSTAQIAIDMEYLNSTDKDYTVTYKSSNGGVLTVDAKGVMTANNSGASNVTVRMKKSNGKIYTMSCRIDVD
ncbi:MAG: Ig-like domain-containing protein [Pseudobutyrivibrio sp.]|nr:Ig-like domain-containing protein [Pseudobutyrivibrio sp.]